MMSRVSKSLMTAVCVLGASSTVWSDTIYVKEGSSGDGSSWANAYSLLQDALDDADPNVEIWVAEGTYKPTYDYDLNIGDRGNHFRMKNHVAIYGGFPNTDDPGMEDRKPSMFETIFSGDIGTLDDPNNNCYHVFFHPEGTNLDPNTVLDGFTITGGNANSSYPHNAGSGMCCFSCSPTVTNCTFSRNSAVSGGGMYNGSNSSPIVTNCTFSNNGAENNGGGMQNIERSNPIVTNCIFSGNAGETYGGGMYNEESSPIVTNCTFRGNSVYRNSQTTSVGGGMANIACSPMLVNCTFSGNVAGPDIGGIAKYEKKSTLANRLFVYTSGGGMYNQGSNTTIVNCTFSGNYSVERGGGIANYNCNPILTNCILWGNNAPSGPQIYNANATPTINYSDIAGDGSGAGNIDSDPLFIDADGLDNVVGTEDDNLQLAYNSPCIDAGDNKAVTLDTTDLDGDGDTTERIPLDLAGHNRFTDDPLIDDTGVADPPEYPAVVDMGAYERYEFCGSDDLSQALKGDLNLDCYIDLLDFEIMASYWLQYIGPE